MSNPPYDGSRKYSEEGYCDGLEGTYGLWLRTRRAMGYVVSPDGAYLILKEKFTDAPYVEPVERPPDLTTEQFYE